MPEVFGCSLWIDDSHSTSPSSQDQIPVSSPHSHTPSASLACLEAGSRHSADQAGLDLAVLLPQQCWGYRYTKHHTWFRNPLSGLQETWRLGSNRLPPFSAVAKNHWVTCHSWLSQQPVQTGFVGSLPPLSTARCIAIL